MTELTAPVPDPDSVDAAIGGRHSVRAFLPTPVPRPLLEHLLRMAGQAPSGNNVQPWKVYVLQGAKRDELARQVSAAHDLLHEHPELETKYRSDYNYYPRHWVEPYQGRRRQSGWSLYGLLGIQKGDKARMHAQHRQNFDFFGAPVGLMLTLDRVMSEGSLMDCGMFLQTLMLAARARGLDTCAQAAWLPYASIALPLIGASAEEMLVCGMALGYADPAAPVNTQRTPREPLEAFTHWVQ